MGSIEGGKGLGLVSITERARLVGGTVKIAAELKKGTSVHARVPAHALPKLEAAPGADGGRRELSLP